MGLRQIISKPLARSIAVRYLAVVGIFLVTIQFLAGAMQIRRSFNRQLHTLEQTARRQANFLSTFSPEALLSSDFLTLERLMQRTSEDDEIIYSVIVNPEGQALTRFIDKEKPLVDQVISARLQPVELIEVMAQLEQHPDIYEVQAPIISDGRTLGEVRLSYSTQQLKQQTLNAATVTLANALGISLLLSVLTIILFNRQVKTPLQDLMAVSQTFAAGNLEERAFVNRPDEIGQVKLAFNQMANRLRNSFKELADFKFALDQSSIVAIFDPIGVFTYVNNEFCRISGYSQQELLESPQELIAQSQSTFELPDHAAWSQISAGHVWRGELQNRTKSGEVYWLDTTIVPFLTEQGHPFQYLAIGYEATERKQAEEDLKDFNIQLQHSNRELQDFAYVASHDLQEPLRKIQAFGDRLNSRYSSVLDERGQDYLGRMQNAAERAQTLVNDLLTFSRITTKARPFVSVNLNDIVKDILADLEIQIEQTAGQVNVGDLPIIQADPLQMQQLFQNLISNALKFHQTDLPPVVNIGGQIHHEPAINGDQTWVTYPQCQITVADNGIGFEEKYLDRIFTVFQRLHTRSAYQGTGIGLAICRKIIERHRGAITAKSAPDQGATFIITLPIYNT